MEGAACLSMGSPPAQAFPHTPNSSSTPGSLLGLSGTGTPLNPYCVSKSNTLCILFCRFPQELCETFTWLLGPVFIERFALAQRQKQPTFALAGLDKNLLQPQWNIFQP